MSPAKILSAGVALLLLAACGSMAPNPQAANPALVPILASTGRAATAPGDLKGYSPGQVTALYGEPDLKRVDPPAEVWQYRNAECVVDLFFYDGADGTRLVYAESRLRHPLRGVKDTRCADDAAPLNEHIRQTKL